MIQTSIGQANTSVLNTEVFICSSLQADWDCRSQGSTCLWCQRHLSGCTLCMWECSPWPGWEVWDPWNNLDMHLGCISETRVFVSWLLAGPGGPNQLLGRLWGLFARPICFVCLCRWGLSSPAQWLSLRLLDLAMTKVWGLITYRTSWVTVPNLKPGKNPIKSQRTNQLLDIFGLSNIWAHISSVL